MRQSRDYSGKEFRSHLDGIRPNPCARLLWGYIDCPECTVGVEYSQGPGPDDRQSAHVVLYTCLYGRRHSRVISNASPMTKRGLTFLARRWAKEVTNSLRKEGQK